MAIGFVYLLGNKAMPCYYKIGCTERSPHQRAAELSAASGVPHPFDVLIYIEVDNFQAVERRYHQELCDYRASNQREFFCFGPAHMNWLWWAFESYDHLSMSWPHWHAYAPRPTFPEEYEETWIFEARELILPDAPPLQPGKLELIAA